MISRDVCDHVWVLETSENGEYPYTMCQDYLVCQLCGEEKEIESSADYPTEGNEVL